MTVAVKTTKQIQYRRKDQRSSLKNITQMRDSPVSIIKGIVQQDVRGVESRIKRPVLINYLVGDGYFVKFRVTNCARSKNGFRALTTITWACLSSSLWPEENDGLRTRILDFFRSHRRLIQEIVLMCRLVRSSLVEPEPDPYQNGLYLQHWYEVKDPNL